MDTAYHHYIGSNSSVKFNCHHYYQGQMGLETRCVLSFKPQVSFFSFFQYFYLFR